MMAMRPLRDLSAGCAGGAAVLSSFPVEQCIGNTVLPQPESKLRRVRPPKQLGPLSIATPMSIDTAEAGSSLVPSTAPSAPYPCLCYCWNRDLLSNNQPSFLWPLRPQL
eukprot:6455649-Amphidinium_carterae.1